MISNLNENKCVCKGIRTCISCESYKWIEKKKYDYVIDLTKYVVKKEIISNINTNHSSTQIINHLNISKLSVDDFNEKFRENLEKELENCITSLDSQLSFENDFIKFNKNTFDGFFIIENFVSDSDSNQILKEMDSFEWIPSQSGRKKQEYGPKINYKKRKVNYAKFDFPDYLYKFISPNLEKIQNEYINLSNFEIAEMGNLFYSPSIGSCIDPHIDHYWIWGRILGVNLLSKCIMTFSKEIDVSSNEGLIKVLFEINIPIEQNNLYIMTSSSRYLWNHSIKRENILSNRIVITLREFNYLYKNKIK